MAWQTPKTDWKIQPADENGRYKPIQKDYQSVMAVPYDMLISHYRNLKK